MSIVTFWNELLSPRNYLHNLQDDFVNGYTDDDFLKLRIPAEFLQQLREVQAAVKQSSRSSYYWL